jgi:hypothetical protein
VDIRVLVKNFNVHHFLFGKYPLSSVEILSPEANLSSSHKTKTTSFRRWGIAEADGHAISCSKPVSKVILVQWNPRYPSPSRTGLMRYPAIGEVGSKRPSLGGNGGHFAWWGGLICALSLRLCASSPKKARSTYVRFWVRFFGFFPHSLFLSRFFGFFSARGEKNATKTFWKFFGF